MSERSETHITSLAQVALGVTDLARSVRFYRDVLGAEPIAEFDPPGLASSEEWMAFFHDPDGNTLALVATLGGN